MSRRTSEANKAISAAWAKEQALVQEGKGTRDWTPEQQQDILQHGKAYDENGRAFEGHHMKSAEKYPEEQGNPDNIQFLSRPEHFKAHNGSFQNPTHGFYDYITDSTQIFENDTVVPCSIVDLSKPVINQTINLQCICDNNTVISDDVEEEVTQQYRSELETDPPVNKTNKRIKSNKNFGKRLINTIENFPIQHPVATKIIKGAGVAAVFLTVKALSAGSKSSSEDEGVDSNNDSNLPNDTYSEYSDYAGYEYTNYEQDEEDSENDIPVEHNYPDERSSPCEHMVTGHKRRCHTKDGIIYREIGPYSRGGKNNN